MSPDPARKVAILGTVGVPAQYGGFETLAEALVTAAEAQGISDRITIACSAKRITGARPSHWRGAALRYFNLDANGVQSIPYDAMGLLWAVRTRQDAILLLGVSGAIVLPLVRLLTRARLVVHVDGIEWQRPKWTGLARAYLRLAERLAARWADVVISDNAEITRHLRERYQREAVEITYGSDGALQAPPAAIDDLALPDSYSLCIARIEPENQLDKILDAFADLPERPLVIVGNWNANTYGQSLRARFGEYGHMHLLDPEYDPGRLRAIRNGAALYVHGHSAGGTNPALVEMMPFGIPIAAFDCGFNRETTAGAAGFFTDADDLRALIPKLADPRVADTMGAELAAIAQRRYRWSDVTAAYFQQLGLRDGLSQ